MLDENLLVVKEKRGFQQGITDCGRVVGDLDNPLGCVVGISDKCQCALNR
jgi:hypothetical protein